MSVPISIIKSDSDYDALQPTAFLGAGSSGCVLLGTLRGNAKQYVFKCVLNRNAVERDQIEREIFIGQQLKTRLPPQIAEMFIVTTEAFTSNLQLPKPWTTMMKDKECKRKFKTAVPMVILVQEYVEGIKPAHEWLASQVKEVNANCIRSIMFQLSIALSYAHSTVGFQHNDLKTENIMFLPLKQQTTLEYRIGDDGDLFRVALQKDDVLVRFIDFGASSIRLNEPVPEFLNTSPMHTTGHIPFELSLASSSVLIGEADTYVSPLYDRHYDADSMGMFNIFMNLVCHLRAKLMSDDPNEIWIYKIENGTGLDVFSSKNDSITGYNGGTDLTHIQPLYNLFAKNTILRNYVDKSDTVGTFDTKSMESILNMLALYVALGIYPTEDEEISYIRSNDATTQAMTSVYETIQSKKFIGMFGELVEDATTYTPAKATDMWASIPQLLVDVFGDDVSAQSFLIWLCAPTAQDRAAFGVSSRFKEYLLSNAMYHPFLAFSYWDPNVSSSPAVLPETDAPFKFKTGANGADIISEANKFIAQFDDALVNPLPPSLPEVPPPLPASGLQPTDAIKSNMTDLSKDLLRLYVCAKDPILLEANYGTVAQYEQLVAKPLFDHALSFTDPNEAPEVTDYRDNVTTMLDGYNYIQDENAERLYASREQYEDIGKAKRGLNRQRIFAILLDVGVGNYLLYQYPMNDEAANRARGFFARATSWSSPSTTVENGAPKSAKPWSDYLGSQNFDDAMSEELALLKSIFGVDDLRALLLQKYKLKEITSPALPEMISSLENIERLFEFKPDDAYDLPAIQAQLYAPIREKALEMGPPLERVVKHLGLESETLFGSPKFVSLDMGNEANQTRYFHTLSIVANMINTNDYSELERCFVEWPPKAALRPGEAHEI